MYTECVELLDDQMMRAVNLSGLSSHTYPEKDSLFFKFQGSDETIRETTRLVQKVVKKHGGTGFKAANSAEEAETLWENRKMGLWSTMALVEGAKCWTTDVWFGN
jgi:D-lactate dehydrogenase (cytochrome)